MEESDVTRGRASTIRNELFAAVGILVIGLLILSGMGILDAARHRADIRDAGQANQHGDLLLTSASNWAVERGVTHSALAAAGQVDDKFRAIIGARRAEADAAFRMAVDGLGEFRGFAGKDLLAAEIQTAFKEAVALRRAADRQLGLAKDRRDGAVIKAWMPVMTALILKNRELHSAIAGSIDMDALSHGLDVIEHYAWLAGESAGRERAIIGGMISGGGQLTMETLQRLHHLRGNVDSAWKAVAGAAAGGGIAPTVKEAVERAGAVFFTDFEATRKAVYGAGMAGASYPLTTAEWIERPTNDIDTILAVQVAASAALEVHLEERIFHSEIDLILGFGGLAAAVAAGAAAFWLVGVRVFRPLSVMTEVMRRLTAGDLEVDVPDQDRRDEIDAMARAMTLFKEHALVRRQVVEDLRKAHDEMEARVEERTRELKEIGERERTILENTAEGIITAGEDGLIDTFNPMAETLFGYEAEEVIGKNLSLLMPEQYAPRHDDAIRNYLETGKGKILGVQARELEGQKKDGTPFPIEINLNEFFLGGERRFIGTIRDITERKQAEEEARHNARNQQLLQAVMQAANEARIVEVALEDCLEVVSTHAGWSVGHAYVVEDENPDLLVPTMLWYFDDPGKFETFRRVMQETTLAKGEDLPGKVFESGKPVWVVDASHDADFSKARKTGDFNVASAMAVPIPVRGGVGAVMEFFSDEIKPLDPSLLQIMAQVGVQVGQVIERNEAIEQLAEAMDETELANRAKSQFLANMSHELRTPLNSIIGFSEVVRDGIFGSVGNPRYREYLENIHSSGKHLLDLINDILDVSKVEAGAMALVDEEVNIEEIIASSIRLIEGRAEKGSVTLSTVIPADLPWLLADELRVKQILLNLLSNAVKFTPAGGKITVQAARNDDGTLTISVEDTGIGISEDDIDEMLKPFTQARSSHVQRQEGTGLGLYLVKTLTEMHDGAMEIESKLGAGTRVSVSFPKERIAKAPGKPMARTN